jgi:chromosome segregation ATPase
MFRHIQENTNGFQRKMGEIVISTVEELREELKCLRQRIDELEAKLYPAPALGAYTSQTSNTPTADRQVTKACSGGENLTSDLTSENTQLRNSLNAVRELLKLEETNVHALRSEVEHYKSEVNTRGRLLAGYGRAEYTKSYATNNTLRELVDKLQDDLRSCAADCDMWKSKAVISTSYQAEVNKRGNLISKYRHRIHDIGAALDVAKRDVYEHKATADKYAKDILQLRADRSRIQHLYDQLTGECEKMLFGDETNLRDLSRE